jgi:signal transduction histidine kinase/ligand-binding sensor domain-containing protein
MRLSIFSQQPALHFYHLTTADGLSDNSVNDICQDHEGFLWFATRNGLNRYDGKDFVAFRHSFYDTTSINNNLILHVIADTADNIWFITSFSVSCLNRQTGKFSNYYYKKNDGSIVTTPQLFTSLSLMHNGEIIAFSPFYGFLSIDKSSGNLIPKHFSQIPAGIDLSRQFITPNGCIGYKTDTALYVSKDGGKYFQNVLQKKSLPDNISFSSLVLTSANGATYCFATSGIDKPVTIITRDTFTKQIHIVATPSTILMAVNNYSENIYWMGFWGSGIKAYNNNTGKIISYAHFNKDENTLSNDLVRTLFTDKDKNLWIATEDGIDYCNPEKDKICTINSDVAGFEDMRINSVETMSEDAHGKILIGLLDYNTGAKSGLISFDPLTYKYEYLLKSNAIWEILPDDNDNILLSTQTGLYQFDQQKRSLNRNFKYTFPKEVLNFNKGITILQKDKKGNYWFGLWRKGLIKFDPATNKSIYFSAETNNPDLQLNNDLVASLTEDDNGKIWVSNWVTNTIECIDNNTNKVTHIPLIINGQIFTDKLENILADHNGYLWIGTIGGGLIRFNTSTKEVKLYSENDGLPDESVNSLCLDKQNRLWVYTATGLVWIDTKKGSVHDIDNNILKFSNSHSEEAMLISKEGNMYISNNRNLFFFNPDDVVLKQPLQTPVLTAIHKMDKTFYTTPLQKEIDIFPGEDFLTIDFVSINIRHGKQINYAYRLKGFDDKWQESGNEGKAMFTKLPPGNYELQMRASFRGMNWDGKYSSVLIKVVPAFYQTWWFRFLIFVLLLLLLSWFIYYLSTKKLRQKLFLLKQQQQITSLRNRIASDIHDDIGAGLTKISIQSELAKQNKKALANDYLEVIENINLQSHDLVNSLGEIVWTINPQYDKAESMLAYFRHYIHKFLEGLPLQYHIYFPDAVTDEDVHPDIKRNLFLILKEALNNAVKHAHANELNIYFEINAHHYIMRIEDNGKGMNDEHENIFGNGLKGMKNRAAQINAVLKIASQQNKGTTVFIEGDLYQPS